MQDTSDESISDEGSERSASSSLHSNDDVQVSISGAGSESEKLSSPFLSSPILPSSAPLAPQTARYVPNRDRNFNHVPAVLDLTGRGNDPSFASEHGESNPETYREREVSGELGQQKQEEQQFIDQTEPISSSPSKKKSIIQFIKKSLNKMWIRGLIVAILFIFAGALIFWWHSSAPPLLPLFESPRSFQLKNNGADMALHVNRTSREIRITRQNSHGAWISRYSQAFDFLGNYSYDAREKKWTHLDENVSCSTIRGHGSKCFLKDGKTLYYEHANEVLDVEAYQGRVHILELVGIAGNIRDFKIFDGLRDKKLRVGVPEGHSFKLAFLQSGTVYSVYDNEKSCEQAICIDENCTPVRSPQCNLERVFAARPAHSLVLMHCDPSTARSDTHPFKQLQCTLSQLLLPTLATIARSGPFEYTRPYKEDQLIYGFADYINPSIFHMNRLRLRTDMQWEVVISSYRLIE